MLQGLLSLKAQQNQNIMGRKSRDHSRNRANGEAFNLLFLIEAKLIYDVLGVQ